MNLFLERMKQRPLLGDGAMGTLLLARGVSVGECLEALVVKNPTLIAGVHEEYARAGADIITTHTFGANRIRLSAHGLADKVREFNRQAVDLARSVRASGGFDFLIAGDIGPTGKRVLWDEPAEAAAVAESYREQIRALAVGVDLLIFETFSDLAELEVAIAVAKGVTSKPIIASMSYGENGLTLGGNTPGEVASRISALGVDVVGANCSVGPKQMVETLARMRVAVPDGHFCTVPNAGLPVIEEGQLRYTIGVVEFAEDAMSLLDSGAAMVGGCCGTTPEYIAAIRTSMSARTGAKLA